MKWINAEQQVTVSIYDDEHEEYLDKIMTVEEMLDAYTNEGCPTIYSNPERKPGKWIHREDMDYLDKNKVMHIHFMCQDCGFIHDFIDGHTAQYKYCPSCGSYNGGGEDA